MTCRSEDINWILADEVGPAGDVLVEVSETVPGDIDCSDMATEEIPTGRRFVVSLGGKDYVGDGATAAEAIEDFIREWRHRNG